jgi:hypothetical protein
MAFAPWRSSSTGNADCFPGSNRLTGYQDLRAALVKEVNAETAILDGEHAMVDHLGRSVFAAIMQRRHLARYFAFDLLSLNGQDLRQLPLLARKEKLKRILPSRSPHVLYVDHSRGNGTALYRLACQFEDNRNWIKIKNPHYSQKTRGRFAGAAIERDRRSDRRRFVLPGIGDGRWPPPPPPPESPPPHPAMNTITGRERVNARTDDHLHDAILPAGVAPAHS